MIFIAVAAACDVPWTREAWVGTAPPRWKEINASMQAQYTRCGAIPVQQFFVDDSNKGLGTHYGSGRSDIEAMIASTKQGDFVTAIKTHVKQGDRVLVVGSQSPWYESLCVRQGATTLTLEYNKLTFDHPSMETTQEFPHTKFDVIVSASSLDHDGLGRYGDPLAPDGDLMTMHQLRGLAPLLLISVPIGPDLLAFNLMRIYGPLRLPLLFNGFDVLATYGYDPARLNRTVANYRRTYEPVFALTPTTPDLRR